MKRIALTLAAAALVAGIAGLATRERGLAQEGRHLLSVDDALAGREVRVFFREGFSPYEEFESVHSVDGAVRGVFDEGVLLECRRSYTTRFDRRADGTRVAQFPDEAYAHTLFVPWTSIKYVKRG